MSDFLSDARARRANAIAEAIDLIVQADPDSRNAAYQYKEGQMSEADFRARLRKHVPTMDEFTFDKLVGRMVAYYGSYNNWQ